jgi:hypothetical protein
MGVVVSCEAQATKEVSMCQGDTAIMSVTVANADSLQWYYNNNPVSGGNDDTLRYTTAGTFYLVAFSEHGKCTTLSDFIQVSISYPTVNDDSYVLSPGRTEALNVLHNDNPACAAFNLSTITITKPPATGTVMSITNGMIVYQASNSLLGPDQFSYRITDMNGRTTNEAVVHIDVALDCALLYPNPVNCRWKIF